MPGTKRITNFSLISKKNSTTNTNSTNYSNNYQKKNLTGNFKKEVKIVSHLFTTSYLYDKLKASKKQSKYPSTEKFSKDTSSVEIKLHQGPFDLTCCCERNPKDLKDILINI